MYDVEGMHHIRIVSTALRAWFCYVTLVSGVAAVEAGTIENSKAIKIEKLLTLIRVSELESEYDLLTQKYVSDYEQQIRKAIASAYPDLVGEKKQEIERLLDAFLKDIRKSIGQVETLHDHLQHAYSRNFGEDELDRLIAHYSSPLGEKDAGMKKSAAIEYNKMWTAQFMNQYKARVEKLFQVIAVVAKEKGKGKQGA
jgi:Txe/YoeB family toxin of Txe-Axe toxin-antitoxin module